jgi:ankyrin repeat protein
MEEAFKKKPDHSKEGKYTPLHWASYKGHLKIVWLLLL